MCHEHEIHPVATGVTVKLGLLAFSCDAYNAALHCFS